MPALRRLTFVLLAFLLVGAGCSASDPAAPSGLASTEASNASAANRCSGGTLRGPDGRSIDLTGTWKGFNSGLLFVTQTGSCVTIEGLSNFPGHPLGAEWRSVFSGDLQADFTIAGRYTWTYWVANPEISSGDVWMTTMSIDFDEENQPQIAIAPLDVGLTLGQNPYVVTAERISSSTAYPD